ncbi:unnamed protein product [Trifolium pratense]|uniref:Uncharacterized protein n=1 Tax=Trifolium pratense TaxID=57577 RepID=A0ACB0LAJ0_TRIPR|nr:unnamed protein product [Trifolium pratense]
MFHKYFTHLATSTINSIPLLSYSSTIDGILVLALSFLNSKQFINQQSRHKKGQEREKKIFKYHCHDIRWILSTVSSTAPLTLLNTRSFRTINSNLFSS